MDGFFTHMLSVYGCWLVAAIVGIERIGIPVPGETALVLAGALAATTQALNIHSVVVAACVAVFVGNIAGYWFGKHFGYRLLCRYGGRVGITPPRIKLGQYLFLQHGSKLVVAGQFLPLLREVAAILAGANRLEWTRFLVANAIGGLVWSAFFGYGAYLIGKKASASGRWVEIGLAMIAVMACAAIGFYLHRHEPELQKKADAALPDSICSDLDRRQAEAKATATR